MFPPASGIPFVGEEAFIVHLVPGIGGSISFAVITLLTKKFFHL